METKASAGAFTMTVGGAVLVIGIALMVVATVANIDTGVLGTTLLVLLPLAGLIALITGAVIRGEANNSRPGAGMLNVGSITLAVGVGLFVVGVLTGGLVGSAGSLLWIPAFVCTLAGLGLVIAGFGRRILAALESKPAPAND